MPTGNLISCDDITDLVYVHVGISATIERTFTMTPPANPNTTGLAYDGSNLLHLTLAPGILIYVHDGITSTITETFVPSGTAPHVHGLTYTGSYLGNACVWNNRIYFYVGVSNTPHASFASPGGWPYGLTFDGQNGNVISSDNSANRIYIHQGISGVITSNFLSPGTDPWDLAYDCKMGNLISADQNGLANPSQIYVHSGISSTILESFQAPGTRCRGLTYDLPWFAPQPPTGLLCCDLASSIGAEEECIPAEVSRLVPYFSAIFKHLVPGATARSYQIQVNTASDFAGTELWDSGKTSLMNPVNLDERCENILYGGLRLTPGIIYYWRIAFWDNNDFEGSWSEEAACFKIVLKPPYDLHCEQKTNPPDVTDPRPEFSAIYP